MRLANVEGRAALILEDCLLDVEQASGGRLSSDPMDALRSLAELRSLPLSNHASPLEGARLGPPVPRPQKILAVGLNYRKHAEESGLTPPDEPALFTKLPSALVGPNDDIVIPSGRSRVDWEAELVVVIGRRGKRVRQSEAWDYVAGFTCGQDVSDREEQFRGLRQFTMAKSYDSYAPLGPALVTLDELAQPEDLSILCRVDGEEVQNGRTSDLIFGIPELIEWVTRICTVEPGDLIFTGTPAGVGDGRKPARYLQPGHVLETEIEGIGALRNHVVSG